MKKLESVERTIRQDSHPIEEMRIHYQYIGFDCLNKVTNIAFCAYFDKANKKKELNEIYVKLSKLPVDERLKICLKELIPLNNNRSKLDKKIEEIEFEETVLFNVCKRIFRCLYEENPQSMLWDVKEIREISDKYLETARFFLFLKSTEFNNLSDEAIDLCLSKQFGTFHKKLKYSEKITSIEEVLLEICSPKEFQEDIVAEKKLDTFVRMVLSRDVQVGYFFNGSLKLSENVNFNFFILRSIFRCSIAKNDMKTLEKIFSCMWYPKLVNVFIDYCLELPKDCQAVYLSAHLFYNATSRSIHRIYEERQLIPDHYPPLTPEAYQEAFFTRKL
jgi:hypothetical protein